MLHYYVKSFFADTFLSPYINGTQLVVYYQNDTKPSDVDFTKDKWNSATNTILKYKATVFEEVNIQIFRWDSLIIQEEYAIQFDVGINS